MRSLLLLLALVTASCADETISGYADRDAVYRLEEFEGAPVPWQATISFPEQGRVAGQAPCNAFSADQRVPYPWFELGSIAATRRACLHIQGETEFFAALSRVILAEVAGDVLILSDDHGPVLVFRAE